MAQLLIVADDVAARGDTDVEEVETGSMGMLAVGGLSGQL
jgi:hypothetical protein